MIASTLQKSDMQSMSVIRVGGINSKLRNCCVYVVNFAKASVSDIED